MPLREKEEGETREKGCEELVRKYMSECADKGGWRNVEKKKLDAMRERIVKEWNKERKEREEEEEESEKEMVLRLVGERMLEIYKHSVELRKG